MGYDIIIDYYFDLGSLRQNLEFNHNGAKDIKNETKQNFSIKISKLYEYIQAIIKIKSHINTEYKIGKFLCEYINIIELEIIKKFINSVNRFCNYRTRVLMAFNLFTFLIFNQSLLAASKYSD